jgi:CheY-like chemotaxis protein
VEGDGQRLHQIVTNLVSNAIKFTPPSGRVEVRCEDGGTEVVVQVTDSGQGIPREFLPHVFDRFTQAEAAGSRRQRGLGLGLAIARHLTEMHGGSVAAQSAGPGLGSTFTVRLPLAAPGAGDGTPWTVPAVAETWPVLDGLRVLIVEDDPTARAVLSLAVTQAGADATAVASVAEALAVIAGAAPDVLVTDISLPGENGYVLLDRLRTAGPGGGCIPAVALTGFASNQDRERALSAGFQAHLAKPVDLGVLLSVLLSLGERGASGAP